MHGLQTIVRCNHDATLAYARDHSVGEHLLSAPVSDRFDYNIPWRYNAQENTLHVHIHADTKALDLVSLQRLVEAEIRQPFQTATHVYS